MSEGVTGAGGTAAAGNYQEIYSEYSDVMDQLKLMFPDKTQLAIEQAITEFLAENLDTRIADMDPRDFVNHIAQVFTAEITSEQTQKIITEWEEFADAMDLSPADLADVLDEFEADGPKGSNREYSIMLWQIIQGELEEAVADESADTAETNREMQKAAYEQWLEERTEELQKSGFAKAFDKIKDWAGTIAACVGAAVAWAVAAVAIASGVGAGVGIALCVAATALTLMAANMLVSSIAKECGEELDLFAEVGKAAAKLINLLGGDVDVEQVGMWTSVGINIALAATAAICSFGASSALAGLSGSAAVTTSTMNMVTSGCSVVNGVIGFASAGINLDLALSRAELQEIQALLEQLAEARDMDQELSAKILNIIFGGIRGDLANSMDTHLNSIDSIVAMNLNKA